MKKDLGLAGIVALGLTLAVAAPRVRLRALSMFPTTS